MTAFRGKFSFSFSFHVNVKHKPFSFECFVSVSKSLGYKIIRNNQMPNKTSLLEFNYEMRYTVNRKEQDMWNICWTDSIIAVDFCREMRRFQKINVSYHALSNRVMISTFILYCFTALSWNVWNLSQGSPRTKPESNVEAFSQRLCNFPENLVLSSWVRKITWLMIII